MNNTKPLDISWVSILKISIAGLSFYLLYLMRDILVGVVFALIISVLFEPAIDFLRRFMPRVPAVILVYTIIFGVISLMLYLVAPLFISEIQQFSSLFPEYFSKIAPPLRGLGIEAFQNLENFTQAVESNLTLVSSNIFSALGVIFGGLFSAFSIFTIALFLSLEEKSIERIIGILSPKKYEAVVLNIWQKSQKKVSGWFGTRLLSSLFVAVMTFAACYVLQIQYGVSFGFLAGVLNIIPILGPLVSGAIIVAIVAMDAWLKALFFLAAFLIIQQIEGSILTPVLTKKFIGLPPVLVLVSVLVGGELWGVMGALLAIPIAGIIYEFLRDFLKKRKESEVVVL